MFDALEIGLEAVAALRDAVRVLRGKDADLCRQLRRAGSSMVLNIAEGRRRVGKDRLHLWRVAAGSADEVRVALRTGMAWGDLDERHTKAPLALLDRVVAMLWKLTQ